MSRLTQFARRSKMARSARLSLVLAIRRSELEDKRIATGTRVMCCKAWARALNWSDALNPPADLRRIALETPRLRFVFSAKNKTFKNEIIGCRPLRRQKTIPRRSIFGGLQAMGASWFLSVTTEDASSSFNPRAPAPLQNWLCSFQRPPSDFSRLGFVYEFWSIDDNCF